MTFTVYLIAISLFCLCAWFVFDSLEKKEYGKAVFYLVPLFLSLMAAVNIFLPGAD